MIACNWIYILIYKNNFEASFVRALEVQRSSTFHKRYNIHLKDRYSAVRLISNYIKLRTSRNICSTISGPILRAVEVSQGDKMCTE